VFCALKKNRNYSASVSSAKSPFQLVALKRISCDSFSQASQSLQEILKVSPAIGASSSKQNRKNKSASTSSSSKVPSHSRKSSKKAICPHLVHYYKCWLEEAEEREWRGNGVEFYVVLEMEYCDMGTMERMIRMYAAANGSNVGDGNVTHHSETTVPIEQEREGFEERNSASSVGESQKSSSRVPQHLVVQFLLHISDALRELHAVNIVHRDIKPENILLKSRQIEAEWELCGIGPGEETPTPTEQDTTSAISPFDEESSLLVSAAAQPNIDRNISLSDYERAQFDFKLGDFGLAKDLNVSLANTMAGSMHYMAPEVISAPTSKETYDTAVDMWAVGCILVEMLTLRQNVVFFMQILQGREKFLEHIQHEMNERGYDAMLFEIIDECLSLDPRDRISAAELHDKATYIKEQQDFFHSLRTLPKDVFFDVANFLPLKDLLSLSSVDHSFRDIATASHIWQRQYTVHYHVDPSMWEEFNLPFYTKLIGKPFESWRDLFSLRKMVESNILPINTHSLMHQLEACAHEIKEKRAQICTEYGKQLFFAASKSNDSSLSTAAFVFCLEIFSLALQLHPDSILAWRNKGLTFVSLHMEKEALHCFQEALKICPDEPQLLFSYASFYARYLFAHASEYFSSEVELANFEKMLEDADQNFQLSLDQSFSVMVLIERARVTLRFGNLLHECLIETLNRRSVEDSHVDPSQRQHETDVSSCAHTSQHQEDCTSCCDSQKLHHHMLCTPHIVKYLFDKTLFYLNRSTVFFQQAAANVPTQDDSGTIQWCRYMTAQNALDAQKIVDSMRYICAQAPAVYCEDEMCHSLTLSDSSDLQLCSFSDLSCRYFNKLMEALKIESDPVSMPQNDEALTAFEMFCEGMTLEMSRTKIDDPARCKRVCLRCISTLSVVVDKMANKDSGTYDFVASTLGISYLNLISLLASSRYSNTYDIEEEISIYEPDAVKALHLARESHVRYYNLACLFSIVKKFTDCKNHLRQAIECAPDGYFSASQLENDEDLRSLRDHHSTWIDELFGGTRERIR